MDNYNLILEYAKNNYKKMFREPDGLLKRKFIVPGAAYTNSLWDWDSWLTGIALSQVAEEDTTRWQMGCVLNFLDREDEIGRVPVVIFPDTDTNRQWPGITNVHKPCLAQHAAFIIRENNGDAAWIGERFASLTGFIDYYRTYCRHENGLYFWQDDRAIGVDNDPCTFYRPAKSSGSIFLNCLMVKELEAVCYIGNCLGRDTAVYAAEREHLIDAVRRLCWDDKDGFYYSVDLNLLPVNTQSAMHRGAPRNWDCLIQRIGCWSGFLAMWAGIATPEQAQRMVRENLTDPAGFWAPYGVRTLSKYEKMYQVVASGNPSCWLGPIWGISNYMTFRGLLRYGFAEEANQLADRTLTMFCRDLEQTGTLHEYYDPESGEPIIHPGFQNWNLLAVNMQAQRNGQPCKTEF